MTPGPQQTPARDGFWTTLIKAEALTQVVWAIVIGIVSVTAIIVYGLR